jgi:hypothetical protein
MDVVLLLWPDCYFTAEHVRMYTCPVFLRAAAAARQEASFLFRVSAGYSSCRKLKAFLSPPRCRPGQRQASRLCVSEMELNGGDLL